MLSALEVRERAAVLSGADPAATLAWAVETFPAKVALTVSFGGGGVGLAHLISRIDRSVPVIFLDTRFHFRETYEFKRRFAKRDRKSTRLNSSHSQISYAVFCLKKKKQQ